MFQRSSRCALHARSTARRWGTAATAWNTPKAAGKKATAYCWWAETTYFLPTNRAAGLEGCGKSDSGEMGPAEKIFFFSQSESQGSLAARYCCRGRRPP